MKQTLRLVTVLFSLTYCVSGFAQPSICGNPPEPPGAGDNLKESYETTTKFLKGQADLLSRFAGSADLGGQIQSTRRNLYQNADKLFAARADAYISYVFCEMVMKDPRLSPEQKFKAIQEFRRPFGAIPTVKDALANAGALAVEVDVPNPGSAQDAKFLAEVGQIVTYTLKNYDAISGRGEIAAMSFGYPNSGYVFATDTRLSIVNSSAMQCTGSFERAGNGTLRGRLACRWGNSYPTYNATIRLGG